jgi:hypothetical protein
MLDTYRERGFLDLAQPGCVEQPRELAPAGTDELGLIPDPRIELARRLPK